MSMNNNIKAKSPARRGAWHRRICVATFLAASIITAPAWAHKTFLASERQVWEEGDIVKVALTSALEFPNIEFGPARDRLSFTSVVVGQSNISDLVFEETETALNLSFRADTSGFAVVAMSTHPRSGEIEPDSVAGYFDEIDADTDVRAAFELLPGNPALMRSYSKHTKIFLCLENCEDGRGEATEPVGQALEFVAVASDPRSFVVVRDGERAAAQRVAIHTEDGSHSSAIADANGVFRLEPSISGAVLLSAIWITVPDQPAGVYHSDQATLSIRLP